MGSSEEFSRMLLVSASKGDLETVKKLVEVKGVDVNYSNKRWCQTALHCSAMCGSSAIVRYLVNKGANIEAEDWYRNTPLLEAVEHDQFGVAVTLIGLGANTNAVNYGRQNLLGVAMNHYRAKAVNFVLELGLDISADQYGELLLISAEWGDLKMVEFLVEMRNVDVNYVGWAEQIALHRAADYPALVEYLVHKGANMDKKDINGKTPLFKAVQYRSVESAKILIINGAKTDTVDKAGNNFLDAAMSRYNVELINFVLDLKLDIFVDSDEKLLLKSAHGDDLEKVKSLVEVKRVDINCVGASGHSALHRAVIGAKSEIINYLVNKGANINAQDEKGKTALHIAARDGHAAIAKYLVRNGANVNAPDRDGRTPLFEAVQFGKIKTAETLESVKADIHVRERSGGNLLRAATWDTYDEKTMAFVLGLDLDISDRQYGQTLLKCVIEGDLRAVKILVERKGANVNYEDGYERNGAHLACIEGQTHIFKYLVDKGANINAKDRYGKTARDYALKE